MSNNELQTAIASLLRGRTDRVLLMSSTGPISEQIREEDYPRYLEAHIEGKQRIGIYPMLPDDTVRFGVLDFDSHGAPEPERLAAMDRLANACSSFLNKNGVMTYLERSKSGPGNYHLWVPLEAPMPAAFVRKVLTQVLQTHSNLVSAAGGGVEVFPKQDQLRGGIGNAIFLPFFGSDVIEDKTVFVDSEGRRVNPPFLANDVKQIERLGMSLGKLDTPTTDHTGTPPADDSSAAGSKLLGLLHASTIPEGNRHDSLVSLTGCLRTRGIGEAETLALAQLWNEDLRDSLPDREVQETIQSLFRRPFNSVVSQVQFVTALEALAMEIPETKFLVRDLIPETGLTVLYGEAGCGKSFLALILALKVATGDETWLNYRLDRSGKVLFLNRETHFPEFVGRIKLLEAGLGNKRGLENLLFWREAPEEGQYWKVLRQQLEKHRPALVVVDTFYMMHSVKENESAEVMPVLRKYLDLCHEFGTSIVLLHHPRKSKQGESTGKDRIRGSSAFAGVADTILALSERSDKRRTLTPEKLRHSSDQFRVSRTLRLDEETAWFYDEGEAPARNSQGSGSRGPRLEFESLFPDDGEATLPELCERSNNQGNKASQKTMQRRLKEWMNQGRLKKIRHGVYARQSGAAEALKGGRSIPSSYHHKPGSTDAGEAPGGQCAPESDDPNLGG